MHDAAYKLQFSHRRMVADLLRGFLPGGVSPAFDFDTLEPLPASHVGRALERREGDLMWRLRARAAPNGGWVYVLVLLEFQSGVDRRMALRVLTYTGLAWEGLLRTGKGSGGDARSMTPLPPVIPFVVYNGASPWTAPLDVSDLVAPAAQVLARLQPANRYVLLDVQRTETDRCTEGQRGRLAGGAGTEPRSEEVRCRFCAGWARRWRALSMRGCGRRSPQWVRRSWDGRLRRTDGRG